MRSSLSGPLDRLAGRETVPQVSLAAPSVWLPVIALCAVGLVLRLVDFNRALWEDEMTVAYYTQIGLHNVISTVAMNGSHPPLYFLVAALDAHFHMDVVPALRVPSVVSGVATIAVVYFLVLRLVGRAGAAFAAGLVSVAPFPIWYSDEGRMYALLWLFVLSSYLVLVWGHDSRHVRTFALLHGLTIGLALWTDYSAALAIAPQPILILILRNRRWFLTSWVAGWISIAPWLFFLREQYGRIEAQRFPGVGADLHSWTSVLLDLAWVRADYASLGATLSQPAYGAVLFLLAAAGVLTVVGAMGGRARIAVMSMCLTAGAVAVAVAIALQGAQAVIAPRVMGVVTFGFVLVLTAGIVMLAARESRAMRVLAVACAVVVLGCALTSTAGVVTAGSNGARWDHVASTIETNARAGDELIYYPIATRYGVEPYLSRSSPWRTDYNGSWPKDDATAEQFFAGWTAGKARVWFVFYALGGVDMPQHDRWFIQHGLCRVSGDPTASLGVIEYVAMSAGCPPTP